MFTSRVISWSMQAALKALVLQDRWFGNLVIDPAGKASPFALIKKLRDKGDILRTYMINGWCVISHADVKTLIRDKRLSSEVFDSKLLQGALRASAQGLVVPLIDYPSMLSLDAPDHTRLRKAAAKRFTNNFVQSLTPAIEEIVNELLQKINDDEAFDFMEAIAKPLPAIVIAEMLGVPRDERHLFEEWSADLLGYTEILDPGAVHTAAKGDLAMRAYLQELVNHKRTHPGQDLISSLIETEEEGDLLTEEELLSTCTLLLVAGHETTTRLLGSCLLQLLQHPEQLAAVRSERKLLSNAVEESLRLDPPVLSLSRIVREPFAYKGVRFKKGQVLLLSIAGVNRDPKVIDEPEAFCVHRESFDHISFGHGIHQCLGMPLARLEAKIVLNKLLDKYPQLDFADQNIAWDESPFFRGPSRLVLRSAQTVAA